MQNPEASPAATSPDVLVRMITLTSTDPSGREWHAKTDGISAMELPTILRLVANISEKALTGGR